MKGTYCLIVKLEKDREIKVGALSKIRFKKGYYIYIGSAMNSLKARINRHLSNDKKIHWHIDYLLINRNTKIEEIIFSTSDKRIECDLALSISKNGQIINKFGCSDCKCDSHLIYFENIEKAVNIVKIEFKELNIKYYDLKDFNKI